MSLSKLSDRRLFLAGGVLAYSPRSSSPTTRRRPRPPPRARGRRPTDDLILEFVDKGTLKMRPHGEKADLAIECSYTVGKDGVVKAKISGHEGKDEFKKKLREVAPVGRILVQVGGGRR